MLNAAAPPVATFVVSATTPATLAFDPCQVVGALANRVRCRVSGTGATTTGGVGVMVQLTNVRNGETVREALTMTVYTSPTGVTDMPVASTPWDQTLSFDAFTCAATLLPSVPTPLSLVPAAPSFVPTVTTTGATTSYTISFTTPTASTALIRGGDMLEFTFTPGTTFDSAAAPAASLVSATGSSSTLAFDTLCVAVTSNVLRCKIIA